LAHVKEDEQEFHFTKVHSNTVENGEFATLEWVN
jgi:hypothetical protein